MQFRKILLPFLIASLLLAGASGLFLYFGRETKQTASDAGRFTVVIDAGHGGEDGGAIGVNGQLEKDVNLDIALRLYDLLTANGIPAVLTRTDDSLLYDRNADYAGRKKSLDLAARKRIAEETDNPVFVSIHMNSFPDSRYSGLQVWYSPNNPLSEPIAQKVQAMAKQLLQPQNERKIKASGSNIYLLHRLEVPAILVECGFLSNPEEAERLSLDDYRQSVAFLLFLSLNEILPEIQ